MMSKFFPLALGCLLVFATKTALSQNTTTSNTTTEDTTTELGSGATDDTTTPNSGVVVTTTTAEPCKKAMSLDNVCAEPCDSRYVWCSGGSKCEAHDSSLFSCTCDIGLFNDGNGDCKAEKIFGGQIYFDEPYNESLREETIYSVKSVLDGIYNVSDYFTRSEVTNVTDGSTIATYQLYYQNVMNVNQTLVENSFATGTGCPNTYVSNGLTVNCSRSSDKIVDQSFVCQDSNINSKCDDKTARCNVSSNGILFCDCEESYALPYAGASSCIEIKCELGNEATCSGSFHGKCTSSNPDGGDVLDNYCECTYGFTGERCENPWWFILTVLTGAFGVAAISILIACIVTSKRTKTIKKEPEQGDLDLKNPFVDFQPGIVRARVSSNVYNTVSDSLSGDGTHAHTNPAYNNNSYEEVGKSDGYATALGNDYF